MTAEHTLIGKLTASGMSYADIEGLVDSSDDADSKSGDDADSGSADDEFVGQTSFFGDNSYKDYQISDNKTIAVRGGSNAVPHGCI